MQIIPWSPAEHRRAILRQKRIGLVLGIGLAAGLGIPGVPGFSGPQPVQAQSAPAAAPSFELDGSRLKIPDGLRFETGTAKLAAGSEAVLEHVRAYLEAKSYVSLLRIEGHVSSEQAGAAGQTLSEARAKAAADWLVSKGVSCSRLMPVGFGANKPIADGSTPEGRAQNIRLEFQNAALRGRAIGGMPVDGGGQQAAGWSCAGSTP